jgi:hypothetical protein
MRLSYFSRAIDLKTAVAGHRWVRAQKFTSVRYAHPPLDWIRVGYSHPLTRPSQKKTASGASTALTTPPSKPTPVTAASAAKKKAGTRNKGRAKRPRSSGAAGGSGPVLGGADYVDILLGSRRRQREEVQKLPRGDSAT